MKFIHIADVHLGVQPDRGRIWSNERATEIEESFRDIVRICEREAVDLLLIAGDLFHAPPTVQQLKSLDYQLRTLPFTKTVIIAGNHDYMEENSNWETFEFQSDTIVLPRDRATNAYIKELNVCVTGYSYGKKEYTERILERLRPGREGAYNILLGHGGDKQHMPFSKEKLARLGFDYIALGHIHKPAHILKNRMAFSGSLEPIDYTETGRRGYIMGEVDADHNTQIKWIPHNVRSYINLALTLSPEYSNAEISDIVENRIQELGKEHIYRILLKGCVDHNLQINLSGLTKRYNINEIINHTQADYDMEELLADNENNLLGRFIRTLTDEESTEDENIRSKALRYGIEALLAAGDR
ncbi:MAG: DNA repair exonuclease [Eubacteriales bacterium]|nr:DNA repair exonuclease [Lachnospiraceae bacterium]MDO5126879.1 DNA repair exonuclease [Eubacteriales bacterium]